MKSTLVVGMIFLLLLQERTRARADELPPEYQAGVRKGLEWLAKQQFPDGHWASNGQYPEAMTALSGMSFLMAGCTLREGRYADRLRRAVDWLIARSQPNGLISDPKESGHYMFGHGYAMLFLSSVYGEEGDKTLRRKLEDVLTRAVLFSGRAQSSHGGWHYISAADGGGGDSSSTVTQMQGLRAARNVGVVVPKEIIEKGIAYLRKTTSSQGGMQYSWGITGSRGSVPLTAAALASSFSAGEYDSALVKVWILFCQKGIPMGGGGTIFHDEYTHCYFAQTVYGLGEDRYAKLFPDAPLEARLTWSKYRKARFDHLMRSQQADGSWECCCIGRVYTTAMYLITLQLDKAALPIYQR